MSQRKQHNQPPRADDGQEDLQAIDMGGRLGGNDGIIGYSIVSQEI